MMYDYKKAAVIVGGSNGIGLAISKNLIQRGYRVEILDICEPNVSSEGGGICKIALHIHIAI